MTVPVLRDNEIDLRLSAESAQLDAPNIAACELAHSTSETFRRERTRSCDVR